jgi:hypothetical protein
LELPIMPDANGQELSTEMLDCIRMCSDCHRACTETLVYCMHQGGRHTEPNQLRLLMDCAQICQTSADFMLRGSDQHYATCGACAEVCQRCADDCEQMGRGDNRMAACAEECRRCAESCRQMAGHHAVHA